MGKRVTLVIDENLDKKIRLRQAKLTKQNNAYYSYSRVVTEIVRKSIK